MTFKSKYYTRGWNRYMVPYNPLKYLTHYVEHPVYKLIFSRQFLKIYDFSRFLKNLDSKRCIYQREKKFRAQHSNAELLRALVSKWIRTVE